MAERAPWETAREVTHDEARQACRRLINSHFRNEDGARVSIPANPDRDDDLVLSTYVEQQARAPSPSAPAGPEPTDAQVVAFGDAFYGDLTQWGYSERQRNGLAEDVRRALRAAFVTGVSGNPADDTGTAQA